MVEQSRLYSWTRVKSREKFFSCPVCPGSRTYSSQTCRARGLIPLLQLQVQRWSSSCKTGFPGAGRPCRRIVQQRRMDHGPCSDRILRDVKLLPSRRQSGGGPPAEVRHRRRAGPQLRRRLRGHGEQRGALLEEEDRPLPHAGRGGGEAERQGRKLARVHPPAPCAPARRRPARAGAEDRGAAVPRPGASSAFPPSFR